MSFVPSKHLQKKINEFKPLIEALVHCCYHLYTIDESVGLLFSNDEDLKKAPALINIDLACRNIQQFKIANPYFTYDMRHEIKQIPFNKVFKDMAILALRKYTH